MADIQYLNYGDQQIEQQALLNKLANEVTGYVQKQSWSKKRKDKFMSAYSDLMNRGIIGASNNTGKWMIDVNGNDLNLDSKDRKDREMYQEAAYFIQQQMASLPTEENKKEELVPFDNFQNNFGKYLSKTYYGGNPLRTQEDWNVLDERDSKTGLRGNTNRIKKLSEYLQNYSNSLEEGKYDFKDSPFTDLNDLKTRINTAITALNDGTWDQKDTDALNAIGLRREDWFNNGSGDPYKTDGYEGTYGGYYNEYLPKLEKKKAKELAAKQKAAQQQAYNNTLFFTRGRSKLQGKDPQYLKHRYTTDDKLRKALFQYSQSDIRRLTPDEQSEIHGAYRYLAKDPIDDKLLKQLQSSSSVLYKNAPLSRFKKINGIDGLIWDSVAKQVIQIQNRKQYNASKNTPTDLFKGVQTPEELKEQQKKQAEIDMNTPLSQMTEFTPAMKKEIEAIAWEAASIFNPEAFTGSAMALYASHLRDQANPNRSSLEKWLDRGTAALGGIQGVGDLLLSGKLGYRLYQLGKSIGSVSKFAGIMGATFGAIGAFQARDSIMKLATDWNSLTAQDIENISYGLMGLIGLKSFTTARNKQTIGKQANPTITEHSVNITDKNGQSHNVKIDNETAKQIQQTRTLGKKKSDVDSEILNIPEMKAAIKKYNEGITEPSKKLELEGASINTNSKIYGTNRSGKNRIVQEEQVKNPNAPQYEPIGTKYWSNFWGYVPTGNRFKWAGWQRRAWENTPPEKGKGFFEQLKNFWNPEPIPIKPTETSTGGTLPPSSGTPTGGTSTPSGGTPSSGGTPTGKNAKRKPNSLSQTESKELQSTLRGKNFSTNEFKDESRVVGSIKGFGDLYGIRNSNGTHTLEIDFGGTRIQINGTKADIKSKTLDVLRKDLMKKIDSQIPKENRSRIKFELIKQLKQNGYLKQGGTIDKQRIQKYKEFIKK